MPVPAYARCVRGGLPATTRTWTVLDLVASLPRGQAMTLADRAVQRGWLTADQLERRLREQPGRTGNKQLRIVGSQLGDGAASHSERVLHGILRRAGISGWQANYPVWINGELAAVVDVALPALRIAIEVDGMAFHTDPKRFQRDRTRQNQLTALGWTVLRFTWWDLQNRPGYVAATIRRFGSEMPFGAA